MRLNNRAADAQPHTCAMGFRCKKRIENVVRDMRRHPYAVIANRNKNLLVFTSLRLDDHLPYAIAILHCLDAVDDQIDRDLLQLHLVADDWRKISCQFPPYRY